MNTLGFTEIHRGVVSKIMGDEVEVTYELPDGPMKQIYRLSQFNGGNMPKEGDWIEAIVVVMIKPFSP